MNIGHFSCDFELIAPPHLAEISTGTKSRQNLCAEKFLYIHAKCVGSVGSVASKRKDHCFVYIFFKKLSQHYLVLNQHLSH